MGSSLKSIKMQTIAVEKAVGMVLGHDITRIKPGEFKGRAYKKGHIILPEDIPQLLDLGKESIYVVELPDGYIHENEAAIRIAQSASGHGIGLTEPSEGRVNLFAEQRGLLKVNVQALYRINEIDEIVFATIHNNQQVTHQKPIAGTRIIPLFTGEEKIKRVERICHENSPVVEIKPFRKLDVGLVTTGSEVYKGRIKDEFGPVLKAKFEHLGCRVIKQVFVSDDVEMTVKAIQELLQQSVGLIAVTGGMSVDPDDQTPTSIRTLGGEEITYGSPIFPGAMFMLTYVDEIPIIGLPGCVMYAKTSIFDLIVPRIVAGEMLSRSDIIALGHGGFCEGCDTCRYPVCGFGKGV